MLRYAERRAPEAGSATPSEDQYSFSVVRKEQPLKVVGIIDEEPFGGMRMISRARLFLPTETADKLNMVQFSDVRNAAQRKYWQDVLHAYGECVERRQGRASTGCD